MHPVWEFEKLCMDHILIFSNQSLGFDRIGHMDNSLSWNIEVINFIYNIIILIPHHNQVIGSEVERAWVRSNASNVLNRGVRPIFGKEGYGVLSCLYLHKFLVNVRSFCDIKLLSCKSHLVCLRIIFFRLDHIFEFFQRKLSLFLRLLLFLPLTKLTMSSISSPYSPSSISPSSIISCSSLDWDFWERGGSWVALITPGGTFFFWF